MPCRTFERVVREEQSAVVAVHPQHRAPIGHLRPTAPAQTVVGVARHVNGRGEPVTDIERKTLPGTQHQVAIGVVGHTGVDASAHAGELICRSLGPCFNQQVNRSRARFPEDFMFQLSDKEFAALRLQSATLNSGLKTGRGQHRKYLPYAVTEHGAIMAAALLNSPRATALSIYVVRAFVELRGLLSANKELATKVHALERKVSVHERNIAELADSMAALLATPPPPKRAIGFITPEDKGSKKAQARRKA